MFDLHVYTVYIIFILHIQHEHAVLVMYMCCTLGPQTDSSIIGGMVVEVGDQYIDMSTATKVKKIMQTLREIV